MSAILGDAANQLAPYQMYTLIGLGVFALLYLSVLKPMMARRKDPLEKPPGYASLSQRRAVEREMQNLLVELSEMTRQITAQLDTRTAKLEQLIKQADERLAALKNIDSRPIATPSQMTMATNNFTPDPPDPRHMDVYALADQGRDANQIAAELGKPRGEVELILALRTKG